MGSMMLSMLKNIRSDHLNKNLVGYCIERKLPSLEHADFAAYAAAIYDHNPLYQEYPDIVSPFYPAKLMFPMIKEICTHNELGLNLLKMVHGEQEVIWHQSIHVGDSLKTKITIADILETPAGELLKLSGQLTCNGQLIVESNTGFLVRGRKTGVKKESQPEEERTELFRLVLQTHEGQQLEYARASGDNNFIHTSNILAKLAGLPRTVLQGVCVMAMACTALSEQMVSSDIARMLSIKGRFSQVVIPGQLLEVIGYQGRSNSEINFEIINPSGKKVMKNGVFKFKAT